MLKIFELTSSDERFDFIFDLTVDFVQQKEYAPLDTLIETCLNNKDKCEVYPDILTAILVLTTATKKTFLRRDELYNLAKEIYSKRTYKKPEDLELILKGLK